jgi:predicted unusual protein kinase regulating ubiquinone biosynthesis (AarF/ABC1/UbiB family)
MRVSPFRLIKTIVKYNIKHLFETDKRALGAWLCDELLELGPAFIKLGQFMATRIDVFGKEMTQELGKLQDSIDPVAFEDIRGSIEEGLFLSIEPVPIATASIGQVHRAILKDGQDVVIKIQKPGVASDIRRDIATLKAIISAVSFLDLREIKEAEALVNQYEGFLSVELDYSLEMKNMQNFRKFFDGYPWVKVPRPIATYNDGTVLVMEYVPSVKITDVAKLHTQGIDTKRTAQVLVQTFLQMILVNGTVHCDPHPGNLGIIVESDTLVLYDFGNVVKLDPGFFGMMRRILFALYQKNIDEFTKLLISSKIITLPDDTDILELKAFFRYFVRYLENPDLQALKVSINEGGVIGTSNINFRIDPSFLSIFRVFSLLDGTCTELDPEFSYFEALTPFADDVFKDNEFMGRQMLSDIQKLQSYPIILQNTEETVSRVNQRVSDVTKSLDTFKYLAASLVIMNMVDSTATPERLFLLVPVLYLMFR